MALVVAARAGFGQQSLPDAPEQQLRAQQNLEAAGSSDPAVPTQPCCRPEACSAASERMTCNATPVNFAGYLRFAQVPPTGPKYKFGLAVRNSVDPFNLLTIAGTSAIAVASNAHSAYGPGFEGFAKNSGVAFTQEFTSEFFGTFLIPSLAHQDPHYHRTPNASIKHRIWHSVYQVVWTVDDHGSPMFNYAEVFGSVADTAISDIYVPGLQTGWGASAQRVAIGLATAPTDNLITEFLPDVANKVNFHVVFVQRIINRVAIGPNLAQ